VAEYAFWLVELIVVRGELQEFFSSQKNWEKNVKTIDISISCDAICFILIYAFIRVEYKNILEYFIKIFSWFREKLFLILVI